MMKNRDLARRFAEGATSGEGSHMFIEGDTIYSYGRHFPIAKRLPNGYYLFQKRGYSMSTSRHKNYVRGMLGNIIESEW